MLHGRMSDAERVIDAMRSSEWLRTQWIARVAFGLGSARQGRTRMSTARRAAPCAGWRPVGASSSATWKSSERARSARCPSGSRSPDRNGG
jgi:hypothetical protein